MDCFVVKLLAVGFSPTSSFISHLRNDVCSFTKASLQIISSQPGTHSGQFAFILKIPVFTFCVVLISPRGRLFAVLNHVNT